MLRPALMGITGITPTRARRMDIMGRHGLRAVSLSEPGPGITGMATGIAASMAIAADTMDDPVMGMDDLAMATDDQVMVDARYLMVAAIVGRASLEVDSPAAEFTVTSAAADSMAEE